MSKASLVLENNEGQVSRFIDWNSDVVFVILRCDTKRVDLVENTDFLEEQNISFESLHELKLSQLLDQKNKKPIKIGLNMQLRAVEKNTDNFVVRSDNALSEEDKKTFPLYMKYSAYAHAGILVFILSVSWVTQRYFRKSTEPVTVQVFEQKREIFVDPRPTVNISKNKIILKNKTQPLQKNRSFAKLNKTQKFRVNRPSIALSNRGALGALGGMGKQYRGSGGLNLKATRDNSGVGYGGAASRGGFERGLIGKGLVATGMGNGGSLKGYGGSSDRANLLGGGRPGYSDVNRPGMAGSSGAYFVPLSEDTLIEGGLDQDQINAVVQSHIGQVINCYEQGLQSKPGLSGRVSVNFIINGRGLVNTARVANTSVDSKKVESCIVAKLRGWKFPRPIGQVNVRVTYPFVLKRLSQS